MSDLILEKLSTAQLSPAMQDVMLRAKSAGLHKIAAKMRGQEAFTYRDAVLELTTKLAYDYLKQQKIASGMQALKALEASKAIKLSSIARMPLPGKNAINLVDEAAKKAKGSAPMPATFGGGGGGVSGGAATAAPMTQQAKKTTMRGSNTLQMPSMFRKEHYGVPG